MPRRSPAWLKGGFPPFAPLLLGLLVLAVPTIVNLGQQSWSTEAGAHGPIVLATGLWLLHYDGLQPSRRALAGQWYHALVVLVPGLTVYAFGRAYDFLSLETAGLYAVMLAFLVRVFGFAEVRRHTIPLAYLGFLVPPPGWLIDRITAPLQQLVSSGAETATAMLGYPVARQGVTLIVAQYQLLVEEACAGMNSLVGMIAVCLFYIYLVRRATWGYALARAR